MLWFGKKRDKAPEEPVAHAITREQLLSELSAKDDHEVVEAVRHWIDAVALWPGDNLPTLTKLLFRHWFCEGDVVNGGFDQLFRNSTGDWYKEFVDGYRLIGAESFAQVVEAAIEQFPLAPPEDRNARLELLDDLEREDEFDEIDKRFYALLKTYGEVERLMAKYCREHFDEIWPEGFVIAPKS